MAQKGPRKMTIFAIHFCSECIFFKKTLLRENPRPVYDRRCMHTSLLNEGRNTSESDVFHTLSGYENEGNITPEWCPEK
jgi:hypothetical protein